METALGKIDNKIDAARIEGNMSMEINKERNFLMD